MAAPGRPIVTDGALQAATCKATKSARLYCLGSFPSPPYLTAFTRCRFSSSSTGAGAGAAAGERAMPNFS